MPTGPGVYFGLLDQAAKERVLKLVAKEANTRFKTYRKSILKGTAMRSPRGQARLEAYRQRIPEVWERLEQQFPEKAAEQQKDWSDLEKSNESRLRDLIGELSGKSLSKDVTRGLPSISKAASETSPAPLPRFAP